MAPLEELPAATRLLLVMPASDVLLITADWPHLNNIPQNRLQEALTNLLDTVLLQPADQCHFAVGSRSKERTITTVAVTDRTWMRFLQDALTAAGMTAFDVLPAQLLQREESLQSYEVRLGQAGEEVPKQRVVSWRGEGQVGWGLRLEGDASWEPLAPLPQGMVPEPGGLQTWALEGQEIQAISLRQFEFAVPFSGLQERLLPWRRAIFLAGLAVALQVVAMNGYWAKLAWQKRTLLQAMQALVHDTLPNAPPGVPPGVALKRALESQRLAQGSALPPGAFPALVSRLNGLLANEPGDVLQQLDYHDDALWLRFKTGYVVEALTKKATGQGLALHDQGRGVWRMTAGTR